MLLAADVGNTNVKLGIFDGDNLKFKLRFSTDENKTSDGFWRRHQHQQFPDIWKEC